MPSRLPLHSDEGVSWDARERPFVKIHHCSSNRAMYHHSSGCSSLKKFPVMQIVGLWRTLDALEHLDTVVIHSGPHLMAACLLFSLRKTRAQSPETALLISRALLLASTASVTCMGLSSITPMHASSERCHYVVNIVLNTGGPGERRKHLQVTEYNCCEA